MVDIIGPEEADFLMKMFQVRHIFEHNMGVIDDGFVQKVPGNAHLKGRKYKLEREDADKFLYILLDGGRRLESAVSQS
jgi:hypothetical protein